MAEALIGCHVSRGSYRQHAEEDQCRLRQRLMVLQNPPQTKEFLPIEAFGRLRHHCEADHAQI